jgi:predicted dehydrogenase
MTRPTAVDSGRRDFLKTTALATAATTLASVPLVHAQQGNDVLKIGLIGCGGRGTGAAVNALSADPRVRLTAMGDAFSDRLESSLANLQRNGAIAQKIDVPREKRFTGFNNYQQVIDSGVDVVLLCSPPHFRPAHIEAAVRAGKHIFCEKPVAVDAPGVRRVQAACQTAQQRRLNVVSGLCWRYHGAMRDTFRRIHDGAVGDIVALQCNYNTGPLWNHARLAAWSDMEWQVRNWLYFTWLSGDFNVEQHIHSLDKMMWAMRDVPPVRCVGLGGRQVRTGPEFGHIFDHMTCVYEFAGGIKCFSSCRQQANCANEVKDFVMGTQGKVDVMDWTITGRTPWRYPPNQRRDIPDMYQTEHNELFAAIRAGNVINNGDYMCKSTMMAIMGRMACYTGQAITWEQAMNSREDLSPPRYDWIELPVPPVAQPGVTRFS